MDNRAEYVRLVKEIGQKIIDNAEGIIGDIKGCVKVRINAEIEPYFQSTLTYDKKYVVVRED